MSRLTHPTPPLGGRTLGDPRPLPPKVEGFETAGEALTRAIENGPLGARMRELGSAIDREAAE